MKLFISGQLGDFRSRKLTDRMVKVKNFLDNSKDGELFETLQLANLLDTPRGTLSDAEYFEGSLSDYSYFLQKQRRRYWGKPSTINQLKRETENGHSKRSDKTDETKPRGRS